MNDQAEKLTVDQITSSILGDDDTTHTPDDNSPIIGEEDEVTDDSLEDDDTLDLLDQEDGVEDEEVSDDADTEDDEEDADDTSENEDHYLDIKDEDLIQVKIDGKVETRTIADAKKALSGEGAIEKRLKEATEARKSAQTVLKKSTDDAQEQVNVLMNVINHMGEALFEPRISVPDEKLLETNATQYQRHDLAHKKEVERVTSMKQQFGQLFQAVNQKLQEDKGEYRKAEKALLHDKLPILQDPKLGKKRQAQIIDSAKHYGFSEDEIALAADHRMFLMAHDAAMYRASQEKSDVVRLGKRKTTVPRTLRSGNTTAKTKARQSKKRQQSINNKAKETGKVDDVTLTILQPAGRKRR